MPLTKSVDRMTPATVLPALPVVPTVVLVEERAILGGPPGCGCINLMWLSINSFFSINPHVALVVWLSMCPVGVPGRFR